MDTTPAIKTRLHELEIVIEEGRQTFIDVGNALAEIKERELYKLTHSTFKAYCQERWGFSETYANNTVRAAKVVRSLPQETATMVATERQARELAKAPTEKRAEVMERAKAKADAEQRPVTAKDIAEVVKPVAPVPPAPEPVPVVEKPEPEAPELPAAASPFAFPVAQCLSELQGTLEIILADYSLEDLRKVDMQLDIMKKRVARRIVDIKTEAFGS